MRNFFSSVQDSSGPSFPFPFLSLKENLKVLTAHKYSELKDFKIHMDKFQEYVFMS